MPCTEMISVYRKNHMKSSNTTRGQNAGTFDIKSTRNNTQALSLDYEWFS
jgi:hypothetical protein